MKKIALLVCYLFILGIKCYAKPVLEQDIDLIALEDLKVLTQIQTKYNKSLFNKEFTQKLIECTANGNKQCRDRLSREEDEKIDYEYHAVKKNSQLWEGKLKECADRGNLFCSNRLGYFYFLNPQDNPRYLDAYPYLVKGQYIYTHHYNENVSVCAAMIGFSLEMNNKRDSLKYFKRCALDGNRTCAYKVSEFYSDDPDFKNPILDYAWKATAIKLIDSFNFMTNKTNSELEHDLAELENKIGGNIYQAYMLANIICDKTAKCYLKRY
ncbi:hypothetical protein TUM19329_24510 [Legionella antarctica]|uniref:Sel1 repeat family protein n=1 Tax=Legionella antarctica TaxID=2708020 RepID=A0A6F8T7G6_9GAMM|nr:hypothetical protein [Legionella antarctica]BCA96090.1 hypothetical protein TUM19329_24510 [Legionella antarctica]